MRLSNSLDDVNFSRAKSCIILRSFQKLSRKNIITIIMVVVWMINKTDTSVSKFQYNYYIFTCFKLCNLISEYLCKKMYTNVFVRHSVVP